MEGGVEIRIVELRHVQVGEAYGGGHNPYEGGRFAVSRAVVFPW